MKTNNLNIFSLQILSFALFACALSVPVVPHSSSYGQNSLVHHGSHQTVSHSGHYGASHGSHHGRSYGGFHGGHDYYVS